MAKAGSSNKATRGERSNDEPQPAVVFNLELKPYKALGYEAEQMAGKSPVHIDIQLGPKHAAALFALREAVRNRREVISGTRPCYNNADMVRWMLEQVSSAIK